MEDTPTDGAGYIRTKCFAKCQCQCEGRICVGALLHRYVQYTSICKHIKQYVKILNNYMVDYREESLQYE